MARIELAPEVLDDFDRFLDHLVEAGGEAAPQRVAQIVQSLQVLASSPLIGRPVASGMRELVIGQGSRGYVALYRFVPELDAVFVLALRSQRESGYKRAR
jgi:toxin ParE1/3/4